MGGVGKIKIKIILNNKLSRLSVQKKTLRFLD